MKALGGLVVAACTVSLCIGLGLGAALEELNAARHTTTIEKPYTAFVEVHQWCDAVQVPHYLAYDKYRQEWWAEEVRKHPKFADARPAPLTREVAETLCEMDAFEAPR